MSGDGRDGWSLDLFTEVNSTVSCILPVLVVEVSLFVCLTVGVVKKRTFLEVSHESY